MRTREEIEKLINPTHEEFADMISDVWGTHGRHGCDALPLAFWLLENLEDWRRIPQPQAVDAPGTASAPQMLDTKETP
jgi:hypothetical protein